MTDVPDRMPPASEDRDRLQMLQVIEAAERETRLCSCGALMSIAARDDALWIQCPSFRETPEGRLAWLRAGLREVLHDRRVVVTGLGRAA